MANIPRPAEKPAVSPAELRAQRAIVALVRQRSINAMLAAQVKGVRHG